MMKKIIILSCIALLAGVLKGEATLYYQMKKPFTGGGNGEYQKIPLNPDTFPVKSGAVMIEFKLNSPITSGTATLFDLLGTPDYFDRLLLRLVQDPKRGLLLDFTACETDKGRYAGNHLTLPVELSPGKNHVVAASWDNINSGKNNATLKLYLDGTLLMETTGIELSIRNRANDFLLGGVHPPFEHGPSKILTIERFQIVAGPVAEYEFSAFATPKAESFSNQAMLSIHEDSKPVTIDGVFNSDEWENAASSSPMVLFSDSTAANFNTDLRIRRNGNKLQIGFRAKSNSAAICKINADDGALWDDESIELIFSPDNRTILHFIGNANGKIYDEMSQDGGKTFDRGYQGKWNYKTTSSSPDFWEGELEFDVTTHGLPPIENGDQWKFNAFRNGFSPQQQTTWNPVKKSEDIRQIANLGLLNFSDHTAVIHFPDHPKLFPGQSAWNLDVKSIAPATDFVTVELIFANRQKQYRNARRISQNSIGAQTMKFDVPQNGNYDALIQVYDRHGRRILYRPFAAKVEQTLNVEVKASFPQEKAAVAVDGSRIMNVAKGNVNLLDSKKNILLTTPLKSAKEVATLDLSTIAAGDYIISIELFDINGALIVSRQEKFHRYTRPETIREEAGKETFWSNWTPVRRDGQTVSCVNREYVFQDTIFPTEIRSGGKDLLIDKTVFQYKINGQSKTISQAKLTVTHETPEKVVFQFSAVNDDLTISGDVAIEYDGAIIYDLQLSPKKKNITDFNLILKLNPESAAYIIEGTEQTFTAEKNIIGKSLKWQKKFPFQYKFGIGNGDRALFWFCESDQNWLPYDRNDTVSITREADYVELKMTIVDQTQSLKSTRMACGFMVTPIKPVNFKLDQYRFVHYWPGGPFFKTDPMDYQRFDIKTAYELGARVIVFHEQWSDMYGSMKPINPQDMHRFVKEAHEMGMKVILYRSHLANQNEPSLAYFNEDWLTYPIVGWNKHENVTYPNTGSGYTRCPRGESYIDFFVASNEALLKEYNLDGFYYDIAVTPCANASHDCGYEPSGAKSKEFKRTTITIDMDDAGKANPYASRRVSWPMLKEREVWKRMYNMVHANRGEAGIINSHLSYSTEVIYCGFADSVCHSEFSACYWDGKKLPTLDQYRIFFSKQFMGLPGDYLCYTPEQRSLLGMALLHREWVRLRTMSNLAVWDKGNYADMVKLWPILEKFGIDAAVWHPYYEENLKIKIASPSGKVYTSYWEKDGKILAVIANLNDNHAESVTVNAENFTQANDVWRQTPLKIDSGKIKNLTIPAQDFTIIELIKIP